MAQKSVKRQTRKRSANKKNTSKRLDDNLNSEIKSIVMMALAFVMGLNIYTPIGAGFFGNFIKNLFIGLFGVGGYILPILFFVAGAYVFFTKKRIESRILILSILMLIMFIVLTDAISGKVYVNFLKSYAEASGFDGGALGGLLTSFFVGILGKVVTIIFMVVSLIISVMLISGKSLLEQIFNIKTYFSNKLFTEYDDEEAYVSSRERRKPKPNVAEKPVQRRRPIEEDIEVRRSDKDYLKRKEEIERREFLAIKKPNMINMKSGKSRQKKGEIEVFDYKNTHERMRKAENINFSETTQPPEVTEQYGKNNDINQEINLSQQDDSELYNYNNELLDELKKQEDLVENLKDELNRQRYLCIETQNELIEQKKIEKSLLKIINAQRETIDKLSVVSKENNNVKEELSQNKFVEPEKIQLEQKEEIIHKIEEDKIEIDYIEEPVEREITEKNVEVIEEEKLDSVVESNPFADTNDFDIREFTGLEENKINELDQEKEIIREINQVSEEDMENLRRAEGGPLSTKEDVESFEEGREILESLQPIVIEKVEEPIKEKIPSIFDKQEPTRYEEKPKEKYVYKYPTVDFLNEKPKNEGVYHSKTALLENSKKLEATLKSFGVSAKVIEVNKGPTVTRYEVQPGLGVKVSKIANLADDLALNLAAKGIRIQAPIPGKPAVGIEVPNETLESVYLREVLEDENFQKFPSKVAFGIGKDIGGNIVVADLAKMPHLLIAGATGAGKSVCINTMITSIIYKSSPEEVKLLMIDPKVVELSVYNGIPHLLIPVVTDPKKASAALNWAVREMEKRYKLFADNNVRDLKGFNQHLIDTGQEGLEPQIVIIIDELADLMMTAAKEVEDSIMRLAAMARAAGIHLIIATQRPSVDVITGVIKSNIPSRLAFAVSSGVDSKTILDSVGAEKLLGKGDMLFSPAGSSEPMRIQGAFISDKEVESIVNFLKTDIDHDYMKEIIEDITSTSNQGKNISSDKVDELLEEVVEFIIERQKASTSLIQRQFRVGFNRAARIVEELENFGVIGQEEGNKPRKVLMTKAEWDKKFKI